MRVPTKTKWQHEPTLSEWELLVPRSLTAVDKKSLSNLLGLRGKSLESALARIMEILASGNSRTSSKMSDALPAHRLAALQPALKAAQELAMCLRKMTFYIDGSDSLETSVSAWIPRALHECDRLQQMGRNYRQAIDRGESTDGGSDGGARKHNVYKAKEATRDELRSAYKEIAADQSATREEAFIRLIEEVNKRKPTDKAFAKWIDNL